MTSSLGETVNHLIDGLLAATQRLLDLPLYAVLGGIAILALVVLLLTALLARGGRRRRTVRWLRIGLLALTAVTVVFVFDRRASRLEKRIDRLLARQNDVAAAMLDAIADVPGRGRPLLFDLQTARRELGARFGSPRVRASVGDAATDIVRVHLGRPLAEVVLAVIDLRHPDVEIRLGAQFDEKSLTSAFARESGCTVAINGEAGNSPRPFSGLGPWKGNLMHQGEVLLREDPATPHPFLSFDQHNHAAYTSASATGRGLSPSTYNVIWGRRDAIVDGRVETASYRYNQPRTVMGIDREGTTLFLMVVDGRQPERSWGFTRAEVGWFLHAFGAFNAMLCDEGGSSCIYIEQFGGIVNVPSDHRGRERPTYVHFGISLRGPSSRAGK